ncbi:HAD family hydrolase [Nocardioides korecus]
MLHILEGLGGLGVHEDVVEGITALAEQGRRLVTLSNGATAVAQALFDAAGISDRFEQLLTVQDAARWKPAQEAYRHALDVCALDTPSEAMLVAVHPWDIEGAHHAGLRTAWINRSGASYPNYFAQPDLEASSVLDLARQLVPGPA